MPQNHHISKLSGLNSVSSVFHQFDALDRALIDTSSLIYLSKIRLLSVSSHVLQLMTVDGVVREFGSLPESIPIEIINYQGFTDKRSDTDGQLIETAKNLKLPVISEDKKMLMQAKRGGLPFFNTLMIMNFMIYKKVINHETYHAALDLLQEEAYYDAFIFEYGRMIYERISQITDRKD